MGLEARGCRAATEFRDGSHDFGVLDFPQSRAKLEVLKVGKISVRYDLQGQEELLKAVAQASLERREPQQLAPDLAMR